MLPVVCRHLGCSTAVLRKGSMGQMSIKSADGRMSQGRGVGGWLGDWAGGGVWASERVGKWAIGRVAPLVSMIRHTAGGRANADFSIQYTADSIRHGPLRSSRSG